MHFWGQFEQPELRTFRISLMISQSGQIIEIALSP